MSVAVWSSERLKFTNEDLKLDKLLSSGFSLVLFFPFDTPRGGKEPKRLNDLFFHNLKNLLQLEFERVSISLEIFLEEPASDSNPLMQASKTPLGDDTSSFSFSTSKHLKSTQEKKNKYKESRYRVTNRLTYALSYNK